MHGEAKWHYILRVPYGWTPAKRASNIAKHGVDFLAMDGFDWTTALVRGDTRHGYGEVRLAALGSIRDRMHHVTFTIRRTTVWIISLRKASNKEIAGYEGET